ncbi:Zinc metalloproteinase dpy-31, partial [Trichinella nativa]
LSVRKYYRGSVIFSPYYFFKYLFHFHHFVLSVVLLFALFGLLCSTSFRLTACRTKTKKRIRERSSAFGLYPFAHLLTTSSPSVPLSLSLHHSVFVQDLPKIIFSHLLLPNKTVMQISSLLLSLICLIDIHCHAENADEHHRQQRSAEVVKQKPGRDLLTADVDNPTSDLIDSDIRKKAFTFGQTKQQRDRINFILKQMQQLMLSNVKMERFAVADTKSMVPSLEKRISNQIEANLYQSEDSFHRRLQDQRKNASNSSIDYLKHKPHKEQPGRFMDSDPHGKSPEESGSHYEGDIVLTPEQAEELYSSLVHKNDRRQKRKFIALNARHWDSSVPIDYSFDGSHTSKQERLIELALKHWENVTCLRFRRRFDTPKGNRIIFTDVDGCASNVGRNPMKEPQYVSLSLDCMKLGVIAHEVAHALGFWHEQSRPDRDRFVNVVWRNIDEGSLAQFLKEQTREVDSKGIPYDYGSIMHYRSKAFAKNGDLYTLLTNVQNYQRTIGQRDHLSFNDIRLMNQIYCSHVCTPLNCQRGGYTDPKKCSRCRCPDGFTGKLCEIVMPGFDANCGGLVAVKSRWHYFSSPNYPKAFKAGQECSWLFRASDGLRVELEFIERFDIYCKAEHSLCMDYIEIRNSSDFANTGMRLCCHNIPKQRIYSSTTDMLVLFRSFYRSGLGFRARVRAVPPSGEWEKWGEWSPCSVSCGGCGVQTRQRKCPKDSLCAGESTSVQSCGNVPCEKCKEEKLVSVSCGLWGLFRCEAMQSVEVPCKEKCCTGYTVVNGVCEPVTL